VIYLFYYRFIVTFAALLKESEVVVGNLKDFKIAFSGLKAGNHNFKLSAGDAFFEEFKALDIEKGEVNILLNMEKQERMLIFIIDISGHVEVVCDRCLEKYRQPLAIHKTLYVKLQNGIENLIEESEDVLLLPDHYNDFDISHYIYEFISLSLPIKRVHGYNEAGESLCDEEMMELLEEKERAKTDSGNTGEVDPRWEALRKLKN
jgi:uncharacterized metal-binding protein YceD (DUF177 family)